MRRRPQEDDHEEHDALEAHRAGCRGPADHRRQRARGSADDDVLRRRALEPHGVDHGVEEDGEGEQRGRQPVHQHAQRHDRKGGQDEAEAERLARRNPAGRHGPGGSARHHRVDVGVVPHVERAGSAGADGDRSDGDQRDERIERRGGCDQADKGGEDDKGHDARLEEAHEIAGRRFRKTGDGTVHAILIHKRHTLDLPYNCGKPPRGGFRDFLALAYLTFGSCSHWWNGGGEGSCHSSVVAPSPHGLAPAIRFFENASNTP